MKARLLALALALTVALGSASAAHAGALVLGTSGSPGQWLGTSFVMNSIECTGPWPGAPAHIGRFFTLHEQEIGRSPAAQAFTQDIYMQVRLEWSANGASWYTYKAPRPWQKRTVASGYSSYARFNQEAFDLTPYPGYMWRVRVEARWYVGSTWLGTMNYSFYKGDIYTFGSADAGTLFTTGEGICRVF